MTHTFTDDFAYIEVDIPPRIVRTTWRRRLRRLKRRVLHG